MDQNNTENNSEMSPHTVAIVSHLTVFGLIYAMVKNQTHKSELGAFYIRQTLGITLLGVAGYLLKGSFGSLGQTSGSIFHIAMVVFWVISFINALKGEQKIVPLLGEYFQDWFKSV
ncbi:MAG: hypothetical protein Sapg2KO_19760 [Saprospiraceae bacterium]